MAQDDGIVVRAHDISYVRHTYRSFEFASFEARAGEVLALLSSTHEAARDALLAVAGLVRPTSGSLEVLGAALPARGGLRASGAVSARVGLGVFERVAPVEEGLTVEELAAQEARLHRAAPDVLPLLAAVGAATHAGDPVRRLGSEPRARLSAALALAAGARLALIDLTDPFVNGLSAESSRALMADLRRYAAEHGVAAIVATGEVTCARAADAACALDFDAAEELAAGGATEPAGQADGAAGTTDTPDGMVA
ncbi:hypothetical protein [uncultured Enorma sp.]|uniref:hypothetical protein n=1 Tax=uncultured Enorma sp. TaxID=1714346 RepID=UPI002592F594|nr:hypothetical protein [uncultured Enorma sp.]